MHRRLTVSVPTVRLRDSLSESFMTSCFLSATARRVLAMEGEVRSKEDFFLRTSFQVTARHPARALNNVPMKSEGTASFRSVSVLEAT
jgi:hypothetical protein